MLVTGVLCSGCGQSSLSGQNNLVNALREQGFSAVVGISSKEEHYEGELCCEPTGRIELRLNSPASLAGMILVDEGARTVVSLEGTNNQELACLWQGGLPWTLRALNQFFRDSEQATLTRADQYDLLTLPGEPAQVWYLDRASGLAYCIRIAQGDIQVTIEMTQVQFLAQD